MRQSHAFLLTVLLDDGDTPSLHGRIRFIATDRELLFTQIDEMMHFCIDEIRRLEANASEPTGNGDSED